MILTPQLRQRIEMLQMTALELNELVEQELVANPILEEVMPGEETLEISDNILDQNAAGEGDADVPAANDVRVVESGAESPDERESTAQKDENFETDDDGGGEDINSDPFEEIDYGREFQDYLDPGYKTQEIEYKEDVPSFEQFLTHSPSLSEHLEWQL
jgi:RNA polymerase sigma-54 factor